MAAEPGRRRRPVGTCLAFLALALVSWSSASTEALQEQLGELAARNADLTRTLGAVEASASSKPNPQQVLFPSVVDTRLLKQPVAFDGDRTKRAGWAFTFRAYASAVSTRMVVLMVHAQSATEPQTFPTAQSDVQVNAQLYYVLAMLVKDGAMKRARNAPVGHGSEIWRLLCEKYEPRRRRRFQAMLSATLSVQLKEPLGVSLDSFERQVRAYEDQSGKQIPDEILAATVIAGIDNATVAQHLALNDDTLDTYPKVMGALRTFVRASRELNVYSEIDPMDVDAMTKGKGQGKQGKGKGHEKGKSSKNESKDATDNQSDKECFYCKSRGHIARHCKKRINDEKAKGRSKS